MPLDGHDLVAIDDRAAGENEGVQPGRESLGPAFPCELPEALSFDGVHASSEKSEVCDQRCWLLFAASTSPTAACRVGCAYPSLTP